MAMTATGLKAAIISEMETQGFNPNHPDTNGEAEKYIEALSKAIVTYIQTNAQAADVGTPTTPAGLWNIL